MQTWKLYDDPFLMDEYPPRAYFLFFKSFMFSILVTYSNPASMSCVVSVKVFAALQM